MVNVVSTIDAFEKKFPKAPKSGERRVAIERYFKIGGVLKVFENEKDWPTLTYPNYTILERKLKEVKNTKDLYERNLSGWKKKYKSAENYHKSNQLKKLKEPLYWKHMAKMTLNPDYRKDANSVQLPAHLVGDDKWKPMVKMFVNDLDYRKQLSQTVRESIVYKKDKKVAKYADELKDFRMQTSDKQIQGLEKKIAELELTEKALKELQKWSKE